MNNLARMRRVLWWLRIANIAAFLLNVTLYLFVPSHTTAFNVVAMGTTAAAFIVITIVLRAVKS